MMRAMVVVWMTTGHGDQRDGHHHVSDDDERDDNDGDYQNDKCDDDDVAWRDRW